MIRRDFSHSPLPTPPEGYRYYRSAKEILAATELYAYQHMLLRAWEEMQLSGVLTLNGVPTVYICDCQRLASTEQVAQLQQKFWNQGIATLLLIRDSHFVRVCSSMSTPIDPDKATEEGIEEKLVEKVSLAAQAQWAAKMYIQLGTGHYYNAPGRGSKFQPQQSVDSYLLGNLSAVRDTLVEKGLTPHIAHAFLGRLLFTCYLCDRGIVKLSNYFKDKPWQSLRDLFISSGDRVEALYEKLFPALRNVFNSSMFDSDLEVERAAIEKHPESFEIIIAFLRGDDLSHEKGQPTLGFWAYDFRLIPVETISAIYENFLESEDKKGKQAAGAFYTPRFLAELALDLALKDVQPLYVTGRRYLDPSCGSGIFLVLLFNRLAAEWAASQKRKPAPQEKAEALLARLATLRGVDKNLTACRIACFSLYLAFLDQFDPPDVENYKLEFNKKKLPNLLHAQASTRVPEYPVIREADFFNYAPSHVGAFDLIIGNPPWAGRGTKQAAQDFMEKIPVLLKQDGRSCLLLPAKIFLNRTDKFQQAWLQSVTLSKLIQLADFSFILFKQALCPCSIALFHSGKPLEDHEIEYIAPKVSRMDLRDGLVPVASTDRQWIPLRRLLGAAQQGAISMAWKSYLWGTERDHKFLDYLYSFPRLSERTDLLSDLRRSKKKRTKPWAAGQGFKPYSKTAKSDPDRELKSLDTWKRTDAFIDDKVFKGMVTVPRNLCRKLGDALEEGGNLADLLYSKPDESLFRPPLVLFNQGFSNALFVDYKARFQDSLQSVSGPKEDVEKLQFLTAFLRSPLARYFVFHTAANIATERDKAHLVEVLRLPFFLPDNEFAQPNAGTLIKEVASRIHHFQKTLASSAEELLRDGINDQIDSTQRSEWLQTHRNKAAALQLELNPLIYAYYGLNEMEQALVEDTCGILDRSDTPGSLESAREIPTLRPIKDVELTAYADMLTSTLNEWTTGDVRATASGGIDPDRGLAFVEVAQVKKGRPFRLVPVSDLLAEALAHLQATSTQEEGVFRFQRTNLIFDGPRIRLVKPAVLGQWTRIAAMNDAASIYAQVAEARQQAVK